jgi:hypothetical protein
VVTPNWTRTASDFSGDQEEDYRFSFVAELIYFLEQEQEVLHKSQELPQH